MSDQKQLSACLARYMDTKAFTAKKIGKEQAERMKVRREIATKRARAAIRFFEKPDNFARLSARIEAGCPECGFNTCMCDGSPNNSEGSEA